MRCLAGTFLIYLIAMIAVASVMAGTSFAQRNNGNEIPIASWKFGSFANIDNYIDPIITGNTVSAESLDDWQMRKKRFLDCGLCGEAQSYPEK